MNNFKILREGQYDVKANLTMKIKNELPAIFSRIDNLFEQH